MKRNCFFRTLAGGTLAALGSTAWSQDDVPNSSLFSGRIRPIPIMARAPEAPTPGPDAPPRPGASSRSVNSPPMLQAPPLPTSWYEVPLPPPKEVRVNDLITMRVDISQRLISDGEVQRRKQQRWDAVLNDWIFLNGLRSVKPAPQTDGDQRAQYNVNQQNRATGDLETTESLKFEIATTVAAVLPNGNLVLEAHRKLQINEELWQVSLSGVCRREDIQPGNVILSNNVADLNLSKKELGIIRDGYRRGFVTRFLDTFSPF